MTSAGVDPDLAVNRQPSIALLLGLAGIITARAHHVHLADILACRPVTRVVDQEGVELLGLDRVLQITVLVAGDLSKLKRIRLPHDDEDLDRLGEIGGLSVGVRQVICRNRQ